MTVSEVWDQVRKKRQLARNTVQTWLTRLEMQGWLRRVNDTKGLRFEATKAPQDSADNSAERILKTLFQGSPSQLVMSLAGRGHLTAEEIKKLRELLTQLETHP